jgi:hypothetical protein
MTRQPTAMRGVSPRGYPVAGGRGRRWRALGTAVIVAACAVVVVGLVITNSVAPPPSLPAFSVSTSRSGLVRVVLNDASKVAAVNQRLAAVGARVRVVPLERSCSPLGSPRPSHVAAAEGLKALVLRESTVAVHQAHRGFTTILTASPRGLTGVSFQVHGPAPACVPLTGTLPYKQ